MDTHQPNRRSTLDSDGDRSEADLTDISDSDTRSETEPLDKGNPRATGRIGNKVWEEGFPDKALEKEEAQVLRAAIAESGLLQLAFHFLDYILRAQTAVFEQIHTKRQLPRVIASMAILTMLLASIYGFVMGLGNGPLQAFFSCLKLPLLFLTDGNNLYSFPLYLQRLTGTTLSIRTNCSSHGDYFRHHKRSVSEFSSGGLFLYHDHQQLFVSALDACGHYGLVWSLRGSVSLPWL